MICHPRVAPHATEAALAACPFPTEPVHHPFVWPDSPAALVAGWYRRTDRHAAAPPAMPELLQAAGEGFGPADHPTTTLCLAAMDGLPFLPAVDVGCGSGLLAQAWARRRGQPVLAVDLDPAAVAHARRSAALAGCSHLVEVRRQAVQTLAGSELDGRVVFANLPAAAHRLLSDRFTEPPAAVVLSGIRPHEAHEVLLGYRRFGLRRIGAASRGRFECHVLLGCA